MLNVYSLEIEVDGIARTIWVKLFKWGYVFPDESSVHVFELSFHGVSWNLVEIHSKISPTNYIS